MKKTKRIKIKFALLVVVIMFGVILQNNYALNDKHNRTIPQTPVNVEAKSTQTAIQVNWDNVKGSTSYDVEEDGFLIEINVGSKYVNKKLQPNTEHKYRVRAKNNVGKSNWSSLLIQRTKMLIPDVPSNIRDTVSATSIILSWDSSNNASGYDIKVDGVIIDNGTSTTFKHDGLELGSEHIYRVRAKNVDFHSKWTSLKRIKTFQELLPPHIPENLTATSTQTSITLSWDSVMLATSYDVEVNGETIIANVLLANFVHSELIPNTGYNYRVRASNAGGSSDWSAVMTKSTLPNPPPIPENLTATSTQTSITPSWDSVVGAMSYDVEINGETIIANVLLANFVHSELIPNTGYNYRVRASNAGGSSDWSAVMMKSTLPNPPPIPENLTATSTQTSVTLSWDSVLGATSYDVEVNSETIIANGENTTFNNLDLLQDTEYNYRVRSINLMGTSEWSQLLYVKTLPSPYQVTVVLLDSKGNGISGGEVIYKNGTTYESRGLTGADGTFKTVLPTGVTSVTMRVKYESASKDISQNISTNNVFSFKTKLAKVSFTDSIGNPISGQKVSLAYTTVILGTTDETGTVFKELLPQTYNFKMSYLGFNKEIRQDINQNSEVIFATVKAKVIFKSSEGDPLSGGNVNVIYPTITFGTMDETGIICKEVLPVTYTFKMNYMGSNQEIRQDLSFKSEVVFQTVKAKVIFKDSMNNPIEGAVVALTYPSITNIGVTDDAGILFKELLPVAISFRMNYMGSYTDMKPNIGSNPEVVFQTVKVKVIFKDSMNNPIVGGGVALTYPSITNIGVTDYAGILFKELLPVEISFRMNYMGSYTDMKPNIGSNPEVVFQTVKAKVSFKDISGNPIVGGNVALTYPTITNIGATDVMGIVVKELLPALINFRMSYAGISLDIKQDIGANSEVAFHTVKAKIVLKDSMGNPIIGGSATVGATKLGVTDGTGIVYKELLSGIVTFRMNYLGSYKDIKHDISSNPEVVFTTIRAKVILKDSMGNPITGGIVAVSTNPVTNIGVTDGDGIVFKELLPVIIPLSMNYHGSTQIINKDFSNNVTVEFQTVKTKVTFKNSTGIAVKGGFVSIVANPWRVFGETDQNGSVSRELLPCSIAFRMSYLGNYQEITQDVGLNSEVEFKLVNVKIIAKDSEANPISGCIVATASNPSDVQPIELGLTDNNGIIYKELLPIEYNFMATHNGITKDIKQQLTANTEVVFQTVKTQIKLIDILGEPVSGASVTLINNSYSDPMIDLGVTDSDGAVFKEILPYDFKFKVTHNYTTLEKWQNIELNSIVIFQQIDTTKRAKLLIDPDLLAYYPMNGNFNDATGHGYDLVPVVENQPFDSDNKIFEGNTRFGPTTPETLKYGANKAGIPSDISNGYTMAGFYKKLPGNDFTGELFGFGSSAGTEPRMILRLLWGELNIGGVGTTGNYKFKRIGDGIWHHLAIVIPPSSTNIGTYDFYFDGEYVSTNPISPIPQSYGDFTLLNLTGTQLSGVSCDEITLFKRALLADEIKTLSVVKDTTTSSESTGVTFERVRTEPKPETGFKIQGNLTAHMIDNKWLCVVGDYDDFIADRLNNEFGNYYDLIDKYYLTTDWMYSSAYGNGLSELLLDYRPKIKKNFEDRSYFNIKELNGELSKTINIVDNAYWVNAIGIFEIATKVNKTKISTSNAKTPFFAYLKLENVLEEGKTYEITTANDEKVSFVYNEKQIISYAIKVNQVGYMPDAGKKYAYIGMWLGAGKGKLDLSEYDKKNFYIMDSVTNQPAYTGIISKRFTEGDPYGDTFTHPDGWTSPISGEDVYQLDFSNFTTIGHYYIYIPGIGSSWRFRINEDVMGESFFIHSKGLYNQRCGIAKEEPYTSWEEDACHVGSYKAGFSPNSADNNAASPDSPLYPYNYRDENNNPIDISWDSSTQGIDRFDVIQETATNEFMPEVYGGWHDAADFDRRPTHFQTVQDLLSAYIMNPTKFIDGQQTIPESGNGIPDIIDEAAWGVDVWRRAQNENGGVGCWIEATSHPKNPDPSTDQQPYYLALPTRESSMNYAAYSSLLARTYKMAGANDKATLFYDSAKRAFDYAMDPNNAVNYSWTHTQKTGEKVTYSYIESPNSVSTGMTFKSALNLYYLSGNDVKYINVIKTSEGGYYTDISHIVDWDTTYLYSEIMMSGSDFPQYYQKYVDTVKQSANNLLAKQELDPYRMVNYAPNESAYTNLSWGGSVALRRGRSLIAAYSVTKDTKYRDAALLLNDWQQGANPMGRTWTTGLGKVYPLSLLHLPSESDNIIEPVRGITLYGITGGISYNGAKRVNSLNFTDTKHISLLPQTILDSTKDYSGLTSGEFYSMIKSSMGSKFPIWRRFWSMEGQAVDQNEFTVNETISPCIAFTAALLPDNWMPSDDIKHVEPINTKEEFVKHPGYYFQP